MRDGDLLARIEGDRLALLLTGVQLENLFPVADGFRELMHTCHYVAHNQQRHCTASIGVAVVSKDTPSSEYALEHARLACKSAKQRGRDQTEIYVGEHDARIAREIEAGWTDRLRTALEQERFIFLVQPIVPLAALPTTESAVVQRQGWRVNGAGNGGLEYLFEILIRMVGKDGQLISPSVFVPLAERVGMMPKVDLWVVNRLVKHLAGLKNMKAPIAFNVNLSNMTLADPESLALIEAAIKSSGVQARQLVFEITETSELTSLHTARKFISALKKLGLPLRAGRLRHRLLVVHASASSAGRFREDRRQLRRRHGRQRSGSQDGRLHHPTGAIPDAQGHRRARRQFCDASGAARERRGICTG